MPPPHEFVPIYIHVPEPETIPDELAEYVLNALKSVRPVL